MAENKEELSCKMLVIGGGPGGYVCAIKAGQLGIDTILVEEGNLGGTCLNVGCIPSKAIIHAAEEYHLLKTAAEGTSEIGLSAGNPKLAFSKTIGWKDGIVKRLNQGVGGLLGKAKVKTLKGNARFLDGKTVEVTREDGTSIVKAEHVVIATGSEPVELPSIKFGGNVLSSTEALSLENVPESLSVIGGGYIGLELGIAFAKLGSKVTVVEAADRILPTYDAELTRPVSARLKALGIETVLGAKAKSFDQKAGALLIETAAREERIIKTEKVLVTVGRKPRTTGWGMENLVLNMNGPFVAIDERCETSMRGVYAIGDVTGEPMLAHRAMAQGEMVAEIVAGTKREWDKYCIPAVCFTDPEIVTAGFSPAEASARGIETRIGLFPFQANGRAMTTGREDGFIRIVARADNHVVIGIQAAAAGVSELATAFGLAIEMGARLEDIAQTIHAHPTQGEALQEASLSALGMALHI